MLAAGPAGGSTLVPRLKPLRNFPVWSEIITPAQSVVAQCAVQHGPEMGWGCGFV